MSGYSYLVDVFIDSLWAIAPTAVLGLVFWFIMRAIFRQDRNERRVYNEIREEEYAKHAAEQEKLRATNAADTATDSAK
ncbi:MAG: hypothetical protein WBA28_06025 [Microbacteriaceae bacterium]